MSRVARQAGCGPAKRGGPAASFTLVEMLVSMVVLVILVVLCAQVLGMAMNTWKSGRSQADNFNQARIALDIMARDLETAVVRQDLPAFFSGSTPALTLYTKQAELLSSGVTGNRPLGRVLYAVTTGADGSSLLRRSVNGFNFGDDLGYSPAAWSVAMTSPTIDDDIGSGVLAMKYQFIGPDGLNVLPSKVNQAWTNSASLPGIQSLRAVILSIAVIDGENLKLLNGQGKRAVLQGNFSAADPGSLRSFADAWQAQLDGAGHPLAQGGVPEKTLMGLKFFQRTVILPPSTKP